MIFVEIGFTKEMNLTNTVWKFHDFSIALNFREINFGDSRSAKTAIFAILRAVNFVDLLNSSLQKVKKFIKSKLRASKCLKMADCDFALQESSTLISRKI